MKKILKLLLSVVIAVLACTGLAACDKGDTEHTTPSEASITVRFDLNYSGAENPASAELKSGEKVSRPADPIRENYTFYGWFYNKSGTNQYDFNEVVTENLTLYAAWRSETAVITFDYNYEGGESSTVTVNTLTEVTKPEQPQRDGFKFGGWFTDRRGRNEFVFAGGVFKDTTIYAYWISTDAKVVLNYNYSGAPANGLIPVTLGERVQKPQDPVRNKYKFTGWYTDAAATIAYDFNTEITESTTLLYAGWELTVAEVTFDYNYEGTQSTSTDVDINKAVTKPSDPERVGYNFVNWCTDKEGNSVYNFSEPVKNDFTLYAKWQKKSFTVNFKNNFSETDTSVFSTATALFEETVQIPASSPERTGYTFIGWFTEATCVNQFTATTVITENTDLYAGWTEAKNEKVTVTFKSSENGTVYSTQEVDVGAKINAPSTDPVKAGSIFGGWYTDEKCTQSFTNGLIVSADTIIYAKWLNRYTFEAEYTYLDNKPAQGTSSNGNGPSSLIYDADKFENVDVIGASNGYWVTNLYYTGAELVFEINASEEVTDAVLELRLTPEYYDMVIGPGIYDVEVNGEKIQYDLIFLVGAYKWQTDGGTVNPETNERPFENYQITTTLHLNKGSNVIKLITSNENDHGATHNAETPAVDCIYIYSAVELDWVEGKCYEDNLDKL